MRYLAYIILLLTVLMLPTSFGCKSEKENNVIEDVGKTIEEAGEEVQETGEEIEEKLKEEEK